MENYSIISDSSCDLSDALLQKHSIDLVRYYVSFDKINYYKEREDITVKAFYDTLANPNVHPNTSLPPIQDYIDVFEKHLKEGKDILCICLSSLFSGSLQSSYNAKNILLETYPERRIEIIDSCQATGGQGLLVEQAALMKEARFNLDEVVQKLEILKKTAKINFTVDSLEYLQRGGRIGKVSAFLGSLLNIKPIIVMTNGELFPSAKVRGRGKALKTVIERTLDEIGPEKEKYALCLLDCNKRADVIKLRETLLENGIDVSGNIYDIGVTIGTHTGPTATGICYIKKYTEI